MFNETINARQDSQEVTKYFLAKYLTSDMILYDIGCGEKPFSEFLTGRVRQHIGVDIEEGFTQRAYRFDW